MQRDSADQLDVVGHHVPFDRLAGDLRRGAHQAAAGLAHGCERLGEEVVECLGDFVLPEVLCLPQFAVDPLALDRIGTGMLLRSEAIDVGTQRVGPIGEDAPELGRLPTQRLLGEALEERLLLADLGEHRLEALDLSILP